MKRLLPDAVLARYERLGLQPVRRAWSFGWPLRAVCPLTAAALDAGLSADQLPNRAVGGMPLPLSQAAGLEPDYARGLIAGWDEWGSTEPADLGNETELFRLGCADGVALRHACVERYGTLPDATDADTLEGIC